MPYSYLAGAFVSSLCGFIGMKIATYSNTRTSIAAEEGLNAALNVSFMSGSVMVRLPPLYPYHI